MSGQFISIVFLVVMIALALAFKAMRKTIGLLLVILGAIACLTFIGAVIGIPMIIVGGLMLFI